MSEATDASLREHEERIRQLQADVMLKLLDSLKRSLDIKLAPITLLATTAGATAALIGAVAVLAKLLH